MSVQFLPLTKLQKTILDNLVNLQGYSEGVEKTFERLKYEIGNALHPAINSAGNVAFTDDGKLLETAQPPAVNNNKYVYNGEIYTFLTRVVKRNGVSKVERRLLRPTRRAIADYFSKNRFVQIDRQTREKVAGGKRAP
jgi:hypothetical protein